MDGGSRQQTNQIPRKQHPSKDTDAPLYIRRQPLLPKPGQQLLTLEPASHLAPKFWQGPPSLLAERWPVQPAQAVRKPELRRDLQPVKQAFKIYDDKPIRIENKASRQNEAPGPYQSIPRKRTDGSSKKFVGKVQAKSITHMAMKRQSQPLVQSGRMTVQQPRAATRGRHDAGAAAKAAGKLTMLAQFSLLMESKKDGTHTLGGTEKLNSVNSRTLATKQPPEGSGPISQSPFLEQDAVPKSTTTVEGIQKSKSSWYARNPNPKGHVDGEGQHEEGIEQVQSNVPSVLSESLLPRLIIDTQKTPAHLARAQVAPQASADSKDYFSTAQTLDAKQTHTPHSVSNKGPVSNEAHEYADEHMQISEQVLQQAEQNRSASDLEFDFEASKAGEDARLEEVLQTLQERDTYSLTNTVSGQDSQALVPAYERNGSSTAVQSHQKLMMGRAGKGGASIPRQTGPAGQQRFHQLAPGASVQASRRNQTRGGQRGESQPYGRSIGDLQRPLGTPFGPQKFVGSERRSDYGSSGVGRNRQHRLQESATAENFQAELNDGSKSLSLSKGSTAPLGVQRRRELRPEHIQAERMRQLQQKSPGGQEEPVPDGPAEAAQTGLNYTSGRSDALQSLYRKRGIYPNKQEKSQQLLLRRAPLYQQALQASGSDYKTLPASSSLKPGYRDGLLPSISTGQQPRAAQRPPASEAYETASQKHENPAQNQALYHSSKQLLAQALDRGRQLQGKFSLRTLEGGSHHSGAKSDLHKQSHLSNGTPNSIKQLTIQSHKATELHHQTQGTDEANQSSEKKFRAITQSSKAMAVPTLSAPQDGERKAELPLMKMLKKIKRVKIHKGHVPINSKSIIQDIRSQYHSTKYSSKIAARQSKLLANMRQQSQCSQRMEAAPADVEESAHTCGQCHKPKRRTKTKKRRIDASPARFENGRAKSAQPQLKGMRDGARLAQSDEDNEEAMYRRKQMKKQKKNLKKGNGSPNFLQEFDRNYLDGNDPSVLGYSKEYQMVTATSPMARFSKSQLKRVLQAHSKTDMRSLSPAAKRQHIKELLRAKPHLTHLLKRQRFDYDKYMPSPKEMLYERIKSNSPEANYHLFKHSPSAKKAFLRQGAYCNCSAHSRSPNYRRSPLGTGSRPHQRSRKKYGKNQYQILHESQAEDEESDGDPHDGRYRSPCRRTCSTVHNPAFHFPRVTKATGTRPKSADKVKETVRQAPAEIDWNDTLLHGLVDDLEREVRAEMNAVSEAPEPSIPGGDAENPAERTAQSRNGYRNEYNRKREGQASQRKEQGTDIGGTLGDAGSSNGMPPIERIASMEAAVRTQEGQYNNRQISNTSGTRLALNNNLHQSQDRKVEDIMRAHREYHQDSQSGHGTSVHETESLQYKAASHVQNQNQSFNILTPGLSFKNTEHHRDSANRVGDTTSRTSSLYLNLTSNSRLGIGETLKAGIAQALTKGILSKFKSVNDRTLDMQQIYRRVDTDMLQGQTLQVLSQQECDHQYNLLKTESLREQTYSNNDYKAMMDRIQNSLQHLMQSLMLSREYAVLAASYKQKATHGKKKGKRAHKKGKSPNKDKERPKSPGSETSPRGDGAAEGKDQKAQQPGEGQHHQIIKCLLRCRKLHDARQDIVKILIRTKQREAMLNNLEDEWDNISAEEAKAAYFLLLKVAFRIFCQVDRLRVDNPMLNRPFVYNGDNLQNQLVRQTLNLRHNLRKRFPALKTKDELEQILDKTGKIIKMSELTTLNREIESQGRGGGPSQAGLTAGERLARRIHRRIALGAIRDLDQSSERSEIAYSLN